MISLTKFNGDTFTLNAFMIEQVQSHPDTTITLSNGKKLIVKETEHEVSRLATLYYHKAGLNSWGKGAGESNE